MITLAEAALASTGSEVADVVEAARTVERMRLSDHDLEGILAIGGFFTTMIVIAAGALLIRYVMGRRQAAILELAIRNNQPDVAKEIINRGRGRLHWWVFLVALILSIAADQPWIAVAVIVGFIILMVVSGDRNGGRFHLPFGRKPSADAPSKQDEEPRA